MAKNCVGCKNLKKFTKLFFYIKNSFHFVFIYLPIRKFFPFHFSFINITLNLKRVYVYKYKEKEKSCIYRRILYFCEKISVAKRERERANVMKCQDPWHGNRNGENESENDPFSSSSRFIFLSFNNFFPPFLFNFFFLKKYKKETAERVVMMLWALAPLARSPSHFLHVHLLCWFFLYVLDFACLFRYHVGVRLKCIISSVKLNFFTFSLAASILLMSRPRVPFH